MLRGRFLSIIVLSFLSTGIYVHNSFHIINNSKINYGDYYSSNAVSSIISPLLMQSSSANLTPLILNLPIARNFVLVIDSDNSPDPTPINNAYWNAINSTKVGDEILTFQKYFRNSSINRSLIDASVRGVKVMGIYRDELEPPCNTLHFNKKNHCGKIFIKSTLPHHKNMMILKSDGLVQAIIGSYNPRERTITEPRIHTILKFDILNGRNVFYYYQGEAERLLGKSTTQPLDMNIDVEGGGMVQFQMHPADAHPVLNMLNAITTFESTLWMSFYMISDDTISTLVYDKLKALNDAGCDIRILIFADNSDGMRALEERGLPVQFPTYPVGKAMLGHKLLMIRSGGNLHLIQSSANLTESHYKKEHNLSLYLCAPGLNNIQADLEAEFNRYWK
jgi:phosphatidylserine/phosphatidylglycerophosphate/cardiolipin synthase-like enzyme